MEPFTICNALIANEGKEFRGGVTIDAQGMIERVFHGDEYPSGCKMVDADGAYLLPGAIDEHVHFREPGLTRKGDVESESKAAVAGGITSYMDMPNTKPATLSRAAIEARASAATGRSYANFAFHLGASSNNLDEIRNVDCTVVPAVKVFMGASTGNMQVEAEALLPIFQASPLPILTHCESDLLIGCNLDDAKQRYGDAIPFKEHAAIRSDVACLESVKAAVRLARQSHVRLHIMHVSSALEAQYLEELKGQGEKRVSAETCPHYFTFSANDYKHFGGKIKCNPSIKYKEDREAIVRGLTEGLFATIGSDHAPHLLEEKAAPYASCPSGIRSVQYALAATMELVAQKKLFAADVARLYAHAPADLYGVEKRGYIREGFYADLVLLQKYRKAQRNDAAIGKCGWSPYEELSFHYKVKSTFVNGELVWEAGRGIVGAPRGMALRFKRER